MNSKEKERNCRRSHRRRKKNKKIKYVHLIFDIIYTFSPRLKNKND